MQKTYKYFKYIDKINTQYKYCDKFVLNSVFTKKKN